MSRVGTPRLLIPNESALAPALQANAYQAWAVHIADTTPAPHKDGGPNEGRAIATRDHNHKHHHSLALSRTRRQAPHPSPQRQAAARPADRIDTNKACLTRAWKARRALWIARAEASRRLYRTTARCQEAGSNNASTLRRGR
ncbi:hypothetical protein CERSUDRAFT_113040 [Gelatoporia subvermispora B]|uniref:Uncharacterized protein n=1 Tax=Ceriporiopsis subvermispora (strain B) TaxID=914234 RepID=M2QQR1_CERS8|nr:hypothetical protein CERSUDRAFT_113040 [Gelatoporia subvermispora B]